MLITILSTSPKIPSDEKDIFITQPNYNFNVIIQPDDNTICKDCGSKRDKRYDSTGLLTDK